MTIKQEYRTAPEANISYDFSDIATGTGTEHYYAGHIFASNAVYYRISPETFYSDDKWTSIGITGNNVFNKLLDMDFDLIWNANRTIRGDIIISFPMALRNNQSDGTAYGFIHAKVRQVRDGVETEINNASSAVLNVPTTGTANSYGDKVLTCLVTTDHLKNGIYSYKRGDTFRVTIEGWGRTAETKTANMWVGHDPMGRTDTTIWEDDGITQANIFIPFDLDL